MLTIQQKTRWARSYADSKLQHGLNYNGVCFDLRDLFYVRSVLSITLYSIFNCSWMSVVFFFHSYVSLYCFTVLVFDWGSRGCVTFPPVWKRKSSSELFMTFNYAASVLPKLCAQRIHVSSSPFCFTVVSTAGRGSKRVKEGKIWSCTSQTGSAKKLRLRREIHIGNLM